MEKFIVGAATAAAIASSGLAAAGIATAAPTGPSEVEQTVRTLEVSGYHVVVNRTGAAPLAQCTISSVRPGQTHATVDSRGGGSPAETVISKTVYVDVEC